MQKKYEKHEMPTEIYNFLCDLKDWCDERADADYQGEETGYVCNDEMKLGMEIDHLVKFDK